MAAKRKKKTAATEVSATPAEAIEPQAQPVAKVDATRGEVDTSAKADSVTIGTAVTSGKVRAVRGDVTEASAKADAPRSDVPAAPVTASRTPVGEDQIREQAYHLWKHAGEPQGRDAEYWALAKQMLQSE